MKPSRSESTPTFGREVDLLFLRLIEADASYADYKRQLLKLEGQWLRRAKTAAQQLAVRQAISKMLLTQAFGFSMPWKEFGQWMRRLQRLGFRDLGMRVHAACLYVQSLHLFPRRAREAWDLLADTERRVLRLRRAHPLRREYLESISHAQTVAGAMRPQALD